VNNLVSIRVANEHIEPIVLSLKINKALTIATHVRNGSFITLVELGKSTIALSQAFAFTVVHDFARFMRMNNSIAILRVIAMMQSII
jgi:hypothetical protein